MARSAVCVTVTVVRPSATLATGACALSQPRVSACVSTFSPPSTSPSGAAPPAAWRAAACAACWAAMAAAVRFRLVSE
ncbi:hypothetical protein, partial [Achromobacter xylosoxidans]|uniref:hypothetical protein n=3 Tax=Alcaligenes xylosoxydans xylosoxydans TaxID=85698 RepID=UPI001A94A4E3